MNTINCESTKYFLGLDVESPNTARLDIIIPDNICQHTHKPDDDCERKLIEFVEIWKKCKNC